MVMKRLTAYVSGRVQRTGYRARITEIARARGVLGYVQNLRDGTVKIVAEAEESVLEQFAGDIDIRNTIIHVSSICKGYSDAIDEFDDFDKMVGRGETDERLDVGIDLLRQILYSNREGFEELGKKMDSGFEELGKQTSCGLRELSAKTDLLLEGQNQMIEKQDRLLDEAKGIRKEIKESMGDRLERVEADVAEIKTALKQKGII
jgi:acylphosphatase